EHLLGEEGRGFALAMANFQWERLLMSLGSVGAMQVILDKTIQFALERNAFGRTIGHFQTIRHKIAEMALRAEVGRATTYNALRLFYEGGDAVKQVTIAKLKTQRDAFDVADEALQIFGGAGYMRSTRSSAPRATRGSARSAAAPTRS
ncbi:MAG: hypothetical protein M3229_03865, partial [Actinomycetota bacterium]|nr:hypothetical protein [Actinomycetota bacterium]